MPKSHDFEGPPWPRSGGRLYHHIPQHAQPESESENLAFVSLKPEVSQQLKPVITWNQTNHGKFFFGKGGRATL